MKLVLADDHVLVLDALCAFLREIEPEIEVSRAKNFSEAVKLVAENSAVDLAILDVNMPGMNGLEGLSVMKRRFPDLPIVLLSGQSNPDQIRRSLSLGAAGFIPKELSGEAMIKALQLVLAGEIYVPAIALGGDSARSQNRHSMRAEDANPLDSLTPRERQVLALICDGRTNKRIAREIGLKQATVGYHLGGIYRKLDVSSRTQAATLAMKLGFGQGNRRTS